MIALIQPMTQWMIDVVDCARLHVIALVDPEVRDQRVLGYADKYDWDLLVGVMRKLAPGKTAHLKEIGVEEWTNTVDNSLPLQMLKRVGVEGFKGLEESIKELLDSVAAF